MCVCLFVCVAGMHVCVGWSPRWGLNLAHLNDIRANRRVSASSVNCAPIRKPVAAHWRARLPLVVFGLGFHFILEVFVYLFFDSQHKKIIWPFKHGFVSALWRLERGLMNSWAKFALKSHLMMAVQADCSWGSLLCGAEETQRDRLRWFYDIMIK